MLGVKFVVKLHDLAPDDGAITSFDVRGNILFAGTEKGWIHKYTIEESKTPSSVTGGDGNNAGAAEHSQQRESAPPLAPNIFTVCNKKISLWGESVKHKVSKLQHSRRHASFLVALCGRRVFIVDSQLMQVVAVIGGEPSAAPPSLTPPSTVQLFEPLYGIGCFSLSFLHSSSTTAGGGGGGAASRGATAPLPGAGGGSANIVADLTVSHRLCVSEKGGKQVTELEIQTPRIVTSSSSSSSAAHNEDPVVSATTEGASSTSASSSSLLWPMKCNRLPNLVLPEPVEVMVEHNGLLCVGLKREYSMLSLKEGDACSMLALGRHAPALTLGETDVYLRLQNAVFVVSMRSMPLQGQALRHTIRFEEEPRCLLFRHPFLFAFGEQYCDVYSVYDDAVVERLPVTGCLFAASRSDSAESGVIFAASRTRLWMLRTHTLRSQLTDLIQRFRIENAFHLLEHQRGRMPQSVFNSTEAELSVMAAYARIFRGEAEEGLSHLAGRIDIRGLLGFLPDLCPWPRYRRHLAVYHKHFGDNAASGGASASASSSSGALFRLPPPLWRTTTSTTTPSHPPSKKGDSTTVDDDTDASLLTFSIAPEDWSSSSSSSSSGEGTTAHSETTTNTAAQKLSALEKQEDQYWKEWGVRLPTNGRTDHVHQRVMATKQYTTLREAWVDTFLCFAPQPAAAQGSNNTESTAKKNATSSGAASTTSSSSSVLRMVPPIGAMSEAQFLSFSEDNFKRELAHYLLSTYETSTPNQRRAAAYALLMMSLQARDYESAWELVSRFSDLHLDDTARCLEYLQEYRLLAKLCWSRGKRRTAIAILDRKVALDSHLFRATGSSSSITITASPRIVMSSALLDDIRNKKLSAYEERVRDEQHRLHSTVGAASSRTASPRTTAPPADTSTDTKDDDRLPPSDAPPPPPPGGARPSNRAGSDEALLHSHHHESLSLVFVAVDALDISLLDRVLNDYPLLLYAQDATGATLLMHTMSRLMSYAPDCLSQVLSMISYLIDRGASVLTKDHEGRDALDVLVAFAASAANRRNLQQQQETTTPCLYSDALDVAPLVAGFLVGACQMRCAAMQEATEGLEICRSVPTAGGELTTTTTGGKPSSSSSYLLLRGADMQHIRRQGSWHGLQLVGSTTTTESV